MPLGSTGVVLLGQRTPKHLLLPQKLEKVVAQVIITKVNCGIMRKSSTFSGSSDVVRKACNEEFGRRSSCKRWGGAGERREIARAGFSPHADVKHSDVTNQGQKKKEQNEKCTLGLMKLTVH